MVAQREDKSLARFERIAVLLSGGGALGAYQAGALAVLDAGGYRTNWLVGTSTGAFNAAIMAGNPQGRRAAQLRSFWRRLSALVQAARPPSAMAGLLRRFRRAPAAAGWRAGAIASAVPLVMPTLDTRPLRKLLAETIDFARINGGSIRLSLAAEHLPSGAEILFDNDRHVIAVDHVLASAALPAELPPVWIDGEPYGPSSIVAVSPLAAVLDTAPPADTLCFAIDCYDPAPPGSPGLSRAGQQIAAYRRNHDLRRIIGMLCERLPEEARRDPEIRFCLAQGASTTMNLVHLVHEGAVAGSLAKLADFSGAAVAQRWRAGERDMIASLDRQTWLAPPSRRVGVVVHELRGGAQGGRV